LAVPKRKVSAKEVVSDIRSGLTDDFLMKKYGISAKGLQSLFQKLVTGRFLTHAEIAARTSAEDKPYAPRTEKGEDRQGFPPQTSAPAQPTFPCPACGTLRSADSEDCPRCGVIVSKYREKQFEYGEELQNVPLGRQMRQLAGEDASNFLHTAASGTSKLTPTMILSLIGGLLLLAGIVAPILKTSAASGSLLGVKPGMALLIAACAIGGVVLSHLQYYKAVLIPGLVSLIPLVYYYWSFKTLASAMPALAPALDTAVQQMQGNELAQALLKGMSQALQFKLGWGWGVLLPGAMILVIAGVVGVIQSNKMK